MAELGVREDSTQEATVSVATAAAPASEFEIPFNRSCVVGNELMYISQSLLKGQIAGGQAFSRRCQELLAKAFGAGSVLLTPSCTHALEMSALLLDLKPGDEVILPSFTFVSTANAFVLRGAVPVFADVRRDTLNIDETQLESLITHRTKVIVPVHYAGVGCEMDVICRVADDYGLSVVEDNAHGPFGKFRGRYLGSFGQLATLSFHETKNFTCGEGGALLINDGEFRERAEIIQEKGTDRTRFFRGQVDKYSWVDVGSSYVMSDVLAAFLYGQLEQARSVQARREAMWNRYNVGLRGWADRHEVRLPVVPEHCDQAYHMFYLLLPTPASRGAMIEHLARCGILAVFHYLPLHLSAMGRRFGGRAGDCPVTEDASDRLLRLPFYNDLTQADQTRVIEAVEAFRF